MIDMIVKVQVFIIAVKILVLEAVQIDKDDIKKEMAWT